MSSNKVTMKRMIVSGKKGARQMKNRLKSLHKELAAGRPQVVGVACQHLKDAADAVSRALAELEHQHTELVRRSFYRKHGHGLTRVQPVHFPLLSTELLVDELKVLRLGAFVSQSDADAERVASLERELESRRQQ